jgi:hypothetical protein
MVIQNHSGIAKAVHELLEPERYRGYRARVAAIRNTAVYEIPEVLDTILGRYFPQGSAMSIPPMPPAPLAVHPLMR